MHPELYSPARIRRSLIFFFSFLLAVSDESCGKSRRDIVVVNNERPEVAEIWELMDSYKFFSCTIFILQAHYGSTLGYLRY